MAITLKTKEQILNKMTESFPMAVGRSIESPNGAYERIVFVVQSIDSFQLTNLGAISVMQEVDVNLKRSGTGISIQFT